LTGSVVGQHGAGLCPARARRGFENCNFFKVAICNLKESAHAV
jgi:hypothetical protein